MSITFVVDKIHDLSSRIHSCSVANYICTTPGCYPAELENGGWGNMNKEVIADFVNSGYVKLVTKEDYKGEENAFYLVNLAKKDHFTVFYNFFDHNIIDFLKKTNIPILIYYSLEGIGFFKLKDFKESQTVKNSLGLKNKLIILTLSDLRNIDNKRILLSDLDKELTDFTWVYSTAFFSRYTCPNNNSLKDDTITFWHKNNNILYDHDYQNKKYDFLCLNHSPSKNRQILLQELYHSPKLWNNNLISNRFEFIIDNDLNNTIVCYRERLRNLIVQEKDFYKDNLVKAAIEQDFNLYNNIYTKNSDILTFMSEHYNKLITDHYPLRKLENDHDTVSNDEFNLNWYKDTTFSLVTETHQWMPNLYMPNPMITEKTIKSIIQHHPFYIFSYPNCHTILRELGFKTFEDLLGLPKDGELGNLTTMERLYNLINALTKFDRFSLDFNKIKEYTDHNFYHLKNTDWRKIQCDLLINAIR